MKGLGWNGARRLTAFFAMFMAFAVFGGCGGKEAASLKETALSFEEPEYQWGDRSGETLVLWTRENEVDRVYMQRALARYQELTNNRIEVVEIKAEDFVKKTAAAFSGQGECPDVLLSYGGANVELFDPDKNFYDFTGSVWVDDLTGMSINQAIYHGKIIGLPHWEAAISGTLYNKKLFQKYNIEVPKTQEEFMDACAILLENGITPVYFMYQQPTAFFYQFPLDTLLEDSETLRALNAGEIGYPDLPEMAEVVSWYGTMAKKGYFGPDYQKNTWDGMDAAMASGQYAMVFAWDTWLYTDYSGDPAQFGLMPAFMGVPEEGTFEGPNLALLIVNKHSEKLNTALDFITFMADPYNYNVAFDGICTAPVFKNQTASVSTPQYVEAERLIDRNFRDSTAWLRIRGFSQTDAECIKKYMENPEGYSVEDCLEEMEARRRARIQIN